EADPPSCRHGLFTVTLTLVVPVALAASRTVTTSVREPFGVFVVTQGSATWVFVEASFQTVVPPTVIVYVLLPAAPPSTQMLPHPVPPTVEPGAGDVSVTRRVPLLALATVTLREAVADPPAESVTLRPSVWLPSDTAVVFQENDALVALVVVVNA